MVIFAYVIMVTMTYPWVNMARNMHVMTSSMTCAQEKASASSMDLVNAALGPDEGWTRPVGAVLSIVQKSSSLTGELTALNDTAQHVQEQATVIKESFEMIQREVEEICKCPVDCITIYDHG
jgi:hypothetical protein